MSPRYSKAKIEDAWMQRFMHLASIAARDSMGSHKRYVLLFSEAVDKAVKPLPEAERYWLMKRAEKWDYVNPTKRASLLFPHGAQPGAQQKTSPDDKPGAKE